MELQTKIQLQPQENHHIDYNSKVLLLGSCFAENIGDKLEYFKFQNNINPLGILFHPVAIESLIENVVNGKEYTKEDIFYHNERWHCFDAHSKLSDTSDTALLRDLNQNIKSTNKQLCNSTHIIITLGTSWVYRFNKTNTIVANCHKVPQKEFSKTLLSVNENTSSLERIINLIKQVNKEAVVIFTVSPVRHLKDGFIQNGISKAHLITAIYQILKAEPRTHYFPSYEIMMDELRDYRFYNEDMIHPNKMAVNYIWEKFQGVWISSEAYNIMEEIETIQKGLLHKPFNPDSEAHKEFLQKLEMKKISLQNKFKYIVF